MPLVVPDVAAFEATALITSPAPPNILHSPDETWGSSPAPFFSSGEADEEEDERESEECLLLYSAGLSYVEVDWDHIPIFFRLFWGEIA